MSDDRIIRSEREFIEKYGEQDRAALARLLPDPPQADVDARALELAKAHHAAMGPAMRKHFNLPFLVGPWEGMPPVRREALIAVMRDLLDKGVIA